jgi:hypothetical protein
MVSTGPDQPGSVDDDDTSDGQAATAYQRSTVAFPYSSLRDAEAIAQELHDKWGGTASLDQLAGGMGTGPRGGTFRVKVATSRTFGVTAVKDGVISLTDLGGKLLDPQTRAGARVGAFLTVPLFSRLAEEYKGSLLPPTPGLERKIADLGVSVKQTSKARVAFQRSAEQAGFFKHAKNRLVQPAKLPDPRGKAAGSSPGGSDPDAERDTAAQLSRPDSALPAPLPELWLTLLRDGRSWSAEKTQEFVEAARKLQDLLTKTAESE